MNNKIVVKDLVKIFGGEKKVLNGVNLEVQDGESLVILGASGSGKSVFIKILASLITPTSGDIMIDDTKLTKKNAENIVSQMGFLFQNGALFDSLTIAENIMFKHINANKRSNVDKSTLLDLAIDKLEKVGLNSSVASLYPHEISGGMQKRVALARAIFHDPKIIFFDEPTTGLDPVLSGVINDIIVKCSKEINATTITITHDINSAIKIGDRVVFLYGGDFVWSGKPKDIFNSKNKELDLFVSDIKDLFTK